MAVTIRDIARATGYSIGTAHHSILERYRGFLKALFEARMLADPALEAGLPSIGNSTDNVRQAVDALLARAPRPDALFCYNDSTALIAMRHCLERSLNIPHDIAIVGFDDISAAASAIPPLSSVQIDKDLLGRMGVDCLLEKPASASLEQTPTVQLVVRESSDDD